MEEQASGGWSTSTPPSRPGWPCGSRGTHPRRAAVRHGSDRLRRRGRQHRRRRRARRAARRTPLHVWVRARAPGHADEQHRHGERRIHATPGRSRRLPRTSDDHTGDPSTPRRARIATATAANAPRSPSAWWTPTPSTAPSTPACAPSSWSADMNRTMWPATFEFLLGTLPGLWSRRRRRRRRPRVARRLVPRLGTRRRLPAGVPRRVTSRTVLFPVARRPDDDAPRHVAAATG